MNIFGHILYISIYVYISVYKYIMFIYIYIYSYIKNFLLDLNIRFITPKIKKYW